MSFIGKSQLDYLAKRGNDYNYKYACVKDILENLENKTISVCEYFGGVGIYTYYLKQYLNLTKIKAYDIDPQTVRAFKSTHPDVEIEKQEFFNNQSDFDYDLLVLDIGGSIFDLPKFEKVFTTKKEILFTDTGIFGIYFPSFYNKLGAGKLTPETYFEQYNKKLEEYGYKIKHASYWRKNSVLHLVPDLNVETKITKPDKLLDYKQVSAKTLINIKIPL